MDDKQDEEDTKTKKQPKLRFGQSKRKSAALSFKERLKQRFTKQKAKHALKDLTISSKSHRKSSVTQTPAFKNVEDQTKEPAYRARAPRSRFRSRNGDTHEEVKDKEEDEEGDDNRTGRSSTGYGSRSRTRPSRRTSLSRTRSPAKTNIRDTIREQSSSVRGTSKFTPKKSSSRDRYSSRDSVPSEPQPSIHQETTNKPKTVDLSKKPKIAFKKFDKYSRPNIKKTLFRSKLFDKRPGLKHLGGNDDKQDDKDQEFPDDHESSPSALVISMLDDGDILQVSFSHYPCIIQ